MSDTFRRTATVSIAVPFHDLDPMQVVWHGNYLKYFEIAREALFTRAGLDLMAVHIEDAIVFPVVRAQVKYIRPLRYRDVARVTSKIVEWKRKIVVEFSIVREADGLLCASGITEQVAVMEDSHEIILEIPVRVRKAFE